MGMLYRESVKMQRVWICLLVVLPVPGFSTSLDEQTAFSTEDTLVGTTGQRLTLLTRNVLN